MTLIALLLGWDHFVFSHGVAALRTYVGTPLLRMNRCRASCSTRSSAVGPLGSLGCGAGDGAGVGVGVTGTGVGCGGGSVVGTRIVQSPSSLRRVSRSLMDRYARPLRPHVSVQ